MPRRNDIQKILVIGSGPIVIGQSAEFDYSGTQACKALKQEGYEVVLVNSNPATIMTDPELADRTYIEPLTHEYVEEVIRIEAELLQKSAPPQGVVDAYVAPIGEKLNAAALVLARELRRAGRSIELGDGSFRLKKSFEAADKVARRIVILGEDELQSGILTVKDFASRVQSKIPRTELAGFLAK